MLIHLIEDDPILARSLQINLELESHQVILSYTFQSAIEKQLAQKPEFIILDLGLPDASGFEYLKQLRSAQIQTPVIILSAQSDEDSIVKGLTLGAQDFVKKPYSFKELYARVLVNRIKTEKTAACSGLSYGSLKVDINRRVAIYKDQEIDLNRREFDILAYFLKNAELIVTRENLIQSLDKESEIFDRTIDSHISHIRKCFKTAQVDDIKITSVYGLGYRIEKI